MSPLDAKKPKSPRVMGEAFRRVEAEVWNKEIITGLADNSCKIRGGSGRGGGRSGREGEGGRSMRGVYEQ